MYIYIYIYRYGYIYIYIYIYIFIYLYPANDLAVFFPLQGSEKERSTTDLMQLGDIICWFGLFPCICGF